MATANNLEYQLAHVDAALKKRYSTKKLSNLNFTTNRLLGWVPKTTGITGKSYEVPVGLANIAGGSSSFEQAVISRKSSQYERWSMKRVKAYQTATIDGETMRAMKDDPGAFIRSVTSETDSAVRAHASDTNWAMYRDGSGIRGTVATGGVSTDTLTLGQGEARAFELGMRCRIYDSLDSGLTGTPNVTNTRVTAVNRAANEVTFAVDLTTVAGDVAVAVAAGDFVVREGDQNAKIQGFGAWFPATVTATLFNAVDRTVYPERLAGLQYTPGAAENYDVSLRSAAASAIENEASPDAIFMHPNDISQLDIDLDGDREFDKVRSQDGHVGYDVIKVHCGGLILPIVQDAWCPETKAYLLESQSLELFSIDPFGYVSQDAGILHRLEGEDAVEFRMGFYGNFSAARAPGHNVVANLNHP